MTERTFMKKHEERERVDSGGYLEACVGFDEYQLARLSQKILQPKTYLNVLGASVLFGRDGIMSGSIDRQIQNLLIKSDLTDFSIDALYKLSSVKPKADHVRKLEDEKVRLYQIPTKDEFNNSIFHGKTILKWKINPTTLEMIVQFGKLPRSRSEFSTILSGVSKTIDWDTANEIRQILDTIDKDIFPMEGSDWYDHFIDNLQNQNISTESFKTIKKFVENYGIEKESTLYAFPLLKIEKNKTTYLDLAKDIPIDENMGIYSDGKQWSYDPLKFYISESEIIFNGKVKITCKYSLFKSEQLIINSNNKSSGLYLKQLYTINGNPIINYQKSTAKFNTTDKKSFEIRLKEADPNNNIMRTYLSNIIRQTKTQFLQSHTESNDFDVHQYKADLFQIGKDPGIELGYVYTTDEGIQTGVPFTAYKKTFFFGLGAKEEEDMSIMKNMSTDIAYFNLDSILSKYVDESSSRYIILNILEIMLSKNEKYEYVIFYSKKKSDEIVNLRCQLMAVLKVFPICKDQNNVLERTKLCNSNTEITKTKCISNATERLHNSMPNKFLPKAFENAESLHLAINSESSPILAFDEYFKETEGPGDIVLEMKGDKLLCKSLDNTITWTANTVFEIEYVPEGKKRIRRKFYKNQLKSYSIDNNNQDDDIDIPEFYKKALNIPLLLTEDGELKEKFISNFKYNHPLTLICPYKPVYRCTKEPNYDTLMRPYPSEIDLKSMIDFCKLKGHLLFKVYDQ